MSPQRETDGDGPDPAAVGETIIETLDDRDSGMTVFELRSAVDCDIDTLESALAELKAADRITTTSSADADRRTITANRTSESDTIGASLVDRIREYL